MTPDELRLISDGVMFVVAAGSVYGGIRADLKNMHHQIAEVVKSATRAHERIDQHLERVSHE